MKSLEQVKLEAVTEWMLSHVVPASKYSGIPCKDMAKNLLGVLDEAEIKYWNDRAIAREETMAYEGKEE